MSADEVRDVVAEAMQASQPLEARSGGSKREIGVPREAQVVDLSGLRGVIDYEPSELVLTVRPATPLAEVRELLERHGQMLAFEPIDHGPLFGREEGLATIGGVIAAGVAGPRRVSAGGARDHLLGFEGVSGRGEIFRGGGRVVKNVTGYDVSKVIAGSWGQLALLTELSIKVMPRPRIERTLWIQGLEPTAAVAVMAKAMGSSCAVASAAHVPAGPSSVAVTGLRLEGFVESVAARTLNLREELSSFGTVAIMSEAGASRFWRSVSHADVLPDGDTLWRVHLVPSRAGDFAAAIERGGGQWLLDWAGASAWVGASAECHVREIASSCGGHAALVRASSDIRMRTAVRHPEQPAVAALSARLKQAFDPAGILDPLRFS